MFVTISILLPTLEGGHLEMVSVFKSLVVWLIMGLAYGYASKLIER